MISLGAPGSQATPYSPAIQADVANLANVARAFQNNNVRLDQVQNYLPNAPHIRMTQFHTDINQTHQLGVPLLLLPFNPRRLFFIIAGAVDQLFPLSDVLGYIYFGFPVSGMFGPNVQYPNGIPLFGTNPFVFKNYGCIDNDIWLSVQSVIGFQISFLAFEGTAADLSNAKH
jgi:hypothetical protein